MPDALPRSRAIGDLGPDLILGVGRHKLDGRPMLYELRGRKLIEAKALEPETAIEIGRALIAEGEACIHRRETRR